MNTGIGAVKAAAICLLMASCTHMPPVPQVFYEGPVRPLEEVAVINASGSIQVSAVNGKHVPYMPNKGLHLLPGRYLLTMRSSVLVARSTFETRGGLLIAELQPGHTYYPSADIDKESDKAVFKLIDVGLNHDQNCLVDSYPDHFDLRKNAKDCYQKPIEP